MVASHTRVTIVRAPRYVARTTWYRAHLHLLSLVRNHVLKLTSILAPEVEFRHAY
jgi:hypothetical protein